MEKVKPDLSETDNIASLLSNNIRNTPVTDREILLEKELARRDKEIETLQRVYNSTSVELLETNKAIALLARKYEKISQNKEMEIAAQIEQKIVPSILSIKEIGNESEALELEIDILLSQARAMVRELMHGPDNFNQLTPTEMRVAVLIRNGATSQQIAARLFISESTVKTHRKNIRNKLDLQKKKLNLAASLNKTI